MMRRSTIAGLLILAGAAVAALIVGRLRSPAREEAGAPPTEVTVHVGRVERATLHRYLTAYGRVEPEPPGAGKPGARAEVGSPVSGLLVAIDCVEGRRVKRGATLFRLDSRVARVAVSRAEKTLRFAETTYARQQALLKTDGTSERAVLEARQQRDAAASDLQAARTDLALLRIAAPIAGTVIRIDAKLGQAVDATTILAEIIDLRRLVVSARVPRSEAHLLHPGQEVSLGGENAAGKLLYVGAEVDLATDTVPIRASLPEGWTRQPGEFLDLRVTAEVHPGCLAVPDQAVVTRPGEGTWVMRIEGDKAVRVAVTPGLREAGRTEVEGPGLEEGMAIVTDEAYSLPRETRIRVREP